MPCTPHRAQIRGGALRCGLRRHAACATAGATCTCATEPRCARGRSHGAPLEQCTEAIRAGGTDASEGATQCEVQGGTRRVLPVRQCPSRAGSRAWYGPSRVAMAAVEPTGGAGMESAWSQKCQKVTAK